MTTGQLAWHEARDAGATVCCCWGMQGLDSRWDMQTEGGSETCKIHLWGMLSTCNQASGCKGCHMLQALQLLRLEVWRRRLTRRLAAIAAVLGHRDLAVLSGLASGLVGVIFLLRQRRRARQLPRRYSRQD